MTPRTASILILALLLLAQQWLTGLALPVRCASAPVRPAVVGPAPLMKCGMKARVCACCKPSVHTDSCRCGIRAPQTATLPETEQTAWSPAAPATATVAAWTAATSSVQTPTRFFPGARKPDISSPPPEGFFS